MKMMAQKSLSNNHINLFAGGGMGYYFSEARKDTTAVVDPYDSYYNYYDIRQQRDFFGGPSLMAIVGGPIAHGLFSYDMRLGAGVAHTFKLGIAAYF